MKRKYSLVAIILIIVISVLGAVSNTFEPQYPYFQPYAKVADISGKFYSVGNPGEALAVGTYSFGDGSKVIIGHIDPSELK